MISKSLRRLATASVFGTALVLQAAPVVFSGSDNGAGSASARPNSNAAAAAFDAAAGGLGSLNVIDFESAALGSFTNYSVASGVSINGSDVSANPQTIRNSPFSTPDELFGYNTTLAGAQFISLYGGSVTFSFVAGVQAFGAYISGLQLASETITFFDGSSQTINIPSLSSGVAFVGFTDANASIASITINGVNDIIGIDDVRYVSSASSRVPDTSATLGLLGLGLACVTLFRRRFAR